MTEALPETRLKYSVQETADAFDYYLAPFCGDMYKSAVEKFPSFELLRSVPVYLDQESTIVSGGPNVNGDIGIWMGQAEGVITKSMKLRIAERFKLIDEVLDQPDCLFMPIILAHELGHVIQADPLFAGVFGEIDTRFIKPETDYEGYVRSDLELNADYIAAVIVANTDLGSLAGVVSPQQSPRLWRQWGTEHSIPKTIAMNAGYTV